MDTKTVTKFLSDYLIDLGFEKDNIKDDAKIRDGLGLDSTELVDLSIAIKKEYNVTVKFTANYDMTLADICSFIISHR